jgi:hypothetical protein
MNKKPDDDILLDPAKSVRGARTLLTKLWRRILAERKITPYKWNTLMEYYLNDPTEKIPNTSSARSSARGNLNKELKDHSMTWNVFEKAIRFLRPLRAEFSVKLYWPTGQVSEHVLTMINRQAESEQKSDIVDETPS